MLRKQGYKWYAKTLYKPERPDDINELITNMINNKVPHFFKYAKDKEDCQVSNINNSFVNKLNDIIPNPRINCRAIDLDVINYRLLMNNPRIKFDVAFSGNGKLMDDMTDPLIIKYHELNKKYYNKINFKDENIDTTKCSTVSSLRQAIMYKDIAKEIREELSEFGYTEVQITDILVKYLYHIKNSKHKEALWFCYGKYIVENLKRNVKKPTKVIQCVDCGEWLEVKSKDGRSCRCIECQKETKRKLAKERKRKQRLLKKQDVTLSTGARKLGSFSEC